MMHALGRAVSSLAHGDNVPSDLSGIIYDGTSRLCGEGMPRHLVSRESVVAALPLCESPIEKIMLVGLMTMPCNAAPFVHDPMSGDPFPEKAVVISPQFVIARYRLDFLLTVQRKGNPFLLAVECDGIQFHGALDKRDDDLERDQYLMSFGVRTVRYYGQTIRSRRHKCADEIAAIVNEEMERV